MELNIYNALQNYKTKNPMRMHMPGHKAKRSFCKLFKDGAMDITELDFSDSLENPEGIIDKTQKEISEILGAKKSWLLTDGSTSGIYTMLYTAKSVGDKIIIPHNAHRSVFNACKLFGLEPVIIQGNIKHLVQLPPSAEQIEELLKTERKIAGVFLVSPDYYGNVVDYKNIKAVCNKYKKLLLIDSAHGAQLRFDLDVEYAGDFADMWVDGAHKTLPTLTQGAILSVGNEKLIDAVSENIDMFRTTSPSYPIMASIEYGVKYAKENATVQIDALKRELTLIKTNLKKRGYAFFASQDQLKFCVDFKNTTVSPYLAEEILQKHNIYAEFCDGRYLVFYLSMMNNCGELVKLESVLKKIAKLKQLKNTYQDKAVAIKCVKKYAFLSVPAFDFELVEFDKAVGRVAYKNTGAFPPCYPVVVAGEIISKEAVEVLKTAKFTFGTENGKVYVVKLPSKT